MDTWRILFRLHVISPSRQTFTLVVASYLAYGLVSLHLAQIAAVDNHYQLFDVSPGAGFDGARLKAHFRKYSRQFHPDKNDTEEAQEQFVRIRHAYEILADPLKRFLYDRFGATSGVLDCAHCKRLSEYFHAGLVQQATYYVGTVMVLGIMHTVGSSDARSAFARFCGLAITFGVEMVMLTRVPMPLTMSPVEERVGFVASVASALPFLGGKTINEQIELLRHAFLALTIVISQIIPLWVTSSTVATVPSLNDMVARLETLTTMRQEDTTFRARLTLEPFVEHHGMQRRLREKVVEMMDDMRLFDQSAEYAAAYREAKASTRHKSAASDGDILTRVDSRKRVNSETAKHDE